MSDDLSELIARVEGATERLDDETLGRLLCAVHDVPFGSVAISCGDDGSDEFNVYPAGPNSFRFGGYRHLMPDVSLDAALALARRALPQCRVLVESDHQGLGWAMVCAKPGAPRDMTEAPTPALALILALLHALAVKEKDRGE